MFDDDQIEDSITTLPHDTKSEEAVLGAILIDPGAIKRISLDEDDFYVARNRIIYSAMKAVKTLDFVTVISKLEERNEIDQIGGSAYLMGLLNATPTSMHAQAYADRVTHFSKRRKAIALANEIAQIAYKDKDFDEKFASLGTKFYSLNRQKKGAAVHIKAFLSELYDRIKKAAENPKDIWGMETGFRDWDKILGGHQKQEMIIIAGMPGVGKSIFAYQLATGLAKHGHGGVVYSMEMSALQVLNRQLSGETGIKANSLKSGRIEDDDWTAIVNMIGEMEGLPIYFSDQPSWTTAGIRADLLRLKDSGVPVDWVLIDYLFLLSDKFGNSESERLGEISRNLKTMSRELDINLIVISSLTKVGEDDADPKTSSLRGSAQVGFECDLSAFLTEAKKKFTDAPQVVNVTFSKMREGDKNRIVKIQRNPGIPTFAEVMRMP